MKTKKQIVGVRTGTDGITRMQWGTAAKGVRKTISFKGGTKVHLPSPSVGGAAVVVRGTWLNAAINASVERLSHGQARACLKLAREGLAKAREQLLAERAADAVMARKVLEEFRRLGYNFKDYPELRWLHQVARRDLA